MTVDPAMIPPQSLFSGLKKTSSAIGRVEFSVALMMKDFGNRKSFQQKHDQQRGAEAEPETGDGRGRQEGDQRREHHHGPGHDAAVDEVAAEVLLHEDPMGC